MLIFEITSKITSKQTIIPKKILILYLFKKHQIQSKKFENFLILKYY